MAIRLNDFVIGGELSNRSRNSVNGVIEFAPECGIMLNLSGNFSGQFEGQHIRFKTKNPSEQWTPIADLPDSIQLLADLQVGWMGTIELKQVKVPVDPIQEFYLRSKLGEPTPCVVKDCLYLEWFGQTGRVVAELVDIEVEFVDEGGDPDESNQLDVTPLPSPTNNDSAEWDEADLQSGPSISGFGVDDRSAFEEVDLLPPVSVDEYGLFAADLDQQLHQSLADQSSQDEPTDGIEPGGPTDPASAPGERSWDGVIPGIDPETKAQYEQWDEIYDGKHDESVLGLFDSIELPDPDSLTSEEQAQVYLGQIIVRLAMFNVAIDLCEHMTPLVAYRMLMHEILPNATVHPNLSATNIVQHYSTWELCEICSVE